jgi:hypothetical protein
MTNDVQALHREIEKLKNIIVDLLAGKKNQRIYIATYERAPRGLFTDKDKADAYAKELDKMYGRGELSRVLHKNLDEYA